MQTWYVDTAILTENGRKYAKIMSITHGARRGCPLSPLAFNADDQIVIPCKKRIFRESQLMQYN